MYKTIAALILATFAQGSFADSVDVIDIKNNIQKCVKYIDGEDAAAAQECLKKEYHLADALLNKRYALLVADLKLIASVQVWSSERLQKLVKTQRNWLAFRDSECEFINSADAEEYHQRDPDNLLCLIHETYERAERLSEFMECEGRFYMACPIMKG